MKSRSRLGMSIAIIVVLVAISAAVAVATEFRSWRTDNGVVIQKAGSAYLQQGRDRILEAAALKKLITDTDTVTGELITSNDPLIIDVRFESDYNSPTGHIPGAVRIADFGMMAEPKNLDTLDSLLAAHIQATGNDNIVVYCHLGQMSGLVTGVLGSLGYDVQTLKLGYNMGWWPVMYGKPMPMPSM